MLRLAALMSREPQHCSYLNEIACTEYGGTEIVVVLLVPEDENEIGVGLICDPFWT